MRDKERMQKVRDDEDDRMKNVNEKHLIKGWWYKRIWISKAKGI